MLHSRHHTSSQVVLKGLSAKIRENRCRKGVMPWRFPPAQPSSHDPESPIRSPAPKLAPGVHLPAEPLAWTAPAPHAEKTSTPRAAAPPKQPEASSLRSADSATEFPSRLHRRR